MKKLMLFVAMVFVMLLPAIDSYGQDYKWGAWTQDPCYRGLQFRARNTEFNELAKKHHWYIQYKNNYTQRFAFSYNLAGTREELAEHVKKYGASYRTVIKPGQIDSGMWVLTSNPSQIYEVAGQGRLLETDELDTEGTFRQCDIGGFIGKVDYICNNMPKIEYYCSNCVHPKPPAAIFPKSGYTVASPEDCLEIYEYFTKYRKSGDPVAVKQAIESANALRLRCKLTEEQQTAVGQTIANTQNYLQRIQSDTLQTKPPNDNLLSGTEVVKKIDVAGLKEKIIENLRQNIRPWQKNERTSDYIRVPDRLNADFDDYKNTSIGAKDVNITMDRSNGVTINWVSYYTSTYDKWSEGNSSRTSRITMTITFQGEISEISFNKNNRGMQVGGEGVIFVDETTELWRGRTTFNSETSNFSYQLPYGMDSSGNFVDAKALNELNGLVKQLNQALSGKSANSEQISSEDADLSRIEPTTTENYQRKLVAEAKAKGINLPPNFLTEAPIKKKTLPTRLTPTQRTAQNKQLTDDLAKLIQNDFDLLPSEKEEEAKYARVAEKNSIKKLIIENLKRNLRGTKSCEKPRYGPCNKEFDTEVDNDFQNGLTIRLKPKDGGEESTFTGNFEGLSPFCMGTSVETFIRLKGKADFRNVTVFPKDAPPEGVFSNDTIEFLYGTSGIFGTDDQCKEISKLFLTLKEMTKE